MPDYVAILRRSIASLPEDGPEIRQAVYERARSALARQLTSVEPPLPADEIEAHHQALEEAIETVETEFLAQEPEAKPQEEPPAEAAKPAAAEAEATKKAEKKPAVAGESAGEKRTEAGKAKDAKPSEAEPTEGKASDAKSGDGKAGDAKTGAAAAAGGAIAGGAADMSSRGHEARERLGKASAGKAPADKTSTDKGASTNKGAADKSSAGKSSAEKPGAVSGAGKTDKPKGPPPPPIGEEPPPYPSEKVETSRAPTMVALVLILLIVAGVGAVVYSQWETIVTAYHDITAPRSGEGEEGEADMSAPADETEMAGRESPAGETADEAPASPLTGQVEPDRVEGKDEDRLLSAPPTLPSTPQISEEPAGEAPAGTPGSELASPAGPEAQSEDQTPPLVGQRAIFYEQGADGAAGQAITGAVAWEDVERDDGTPAIQASIDIPERSAVVTITIYKNNDVALPASHLIEIGFSGGLVEDTRVERVPALVLKPNEQARGQPLAGAAVNVTEALFWIALADTQEQVERNLELLRSGSWFDLPILFASGQRALITFEKGIPGDKVFENVMQKWGS